MSEKVHSTAYWEGYLAVGRGAYCRYGIDQKAERGDWAAGIADGLVVAAAGKVWWRSRTLWCSVALVLVGVVLLTASHYGGHSLMAGVGGGLTAGGCLQSALRLMTRQPIYSGGVLFQSTPYRGRL